MTRDELLLTALLGGDASTVVLAVAAGRSERAARYGLRHLVKTGLVWSPERGRWRLSEAGRAIAATITQPPAAPAETLAPDAADYASTNPQAAVTHSSDAQTASAAGGAWSVPAWLWALGAIVLGAVALVSLVARPPTDAAPEPPSPAPLPGGWPYTDWQTWVP
ncbi:MAG TPA: hypothetical protein VNF71_02820 [Acidimicrobiales bacterium]|nr:hypothetical protein [Thermomicrobiaceae bacterium]HVA73480.1 hypothetical protein [Acidimicrobiales bacterium]